MVKWPFQSLSDLQLRDTKVTLNHLASDSVIVHYPFGLIFTSSIFSATWIMSPGSVDLLSHTSCAIRVNKIKKPSSKHEAPQNMEVLRFGRWDFPFQMRWFSIFWGEMYLYKSYISCGQNLAGAKKLDIFDIQETLLLPTLRENPAKFVKRLVGPTGKIPLNKL